MTVRIDSVSYSVGGARLLNGISAEIAPGKLTCLLGSNGAGKTTLLKLITAELKPDSGMVVLPLAENEHRQLAGSRCFAFVPQGIAAPEFLTVREFVELGRFDAAGMPWKKISSWDRALVQESLDLAGVAELSDREMTTLSGGELQRAWIAFCIVQEKPFLLLDESLSAIDFSARRSYFNLLGSICRTGKGVVLVTHDLNMVGEFADHVLLLDSGRLVYSGPAGPELQSALALV